MNYITQFQVCALIILFIISIYYITTPRFPLKQNHMFAMLLLVSAIGSICDITSVYTLAFRNQVPLIVSELFNMASYTCLFILPIIFFIYLASISQKKMGSKALKFCIPTFVVLLLLMGNPYHHLFFHISSANHFVKGLLFWALPFNLLYYVILTLLLVSGTQDTNLIGKRRSLLYICGIFIICTTIEVLTNRYLLTGLAMALSIIVVYLSLQNPADMIDDMTGAYNKNSFLRYIGDMNTKKDSTSIIYLNIDDTRLLNTTYGMTTGNLLLMDFAKYLKYNSKKNVVFRISGDQFAIISTNPENCLQAIGTIQEYFSRPHNIGGLDIRLSACLCYLTSLTRLSRDEEPLVVMEYMMTKAKSQGAGTIFEINDTAMKDRQREIDITTAFRDAVENETLEVYLQPIYSPQKKMFVSAEALSRFNHPILGFIPPDEFIRLAEENGLIIKMGLLVLKKICIFFQTHPELFKMGLETVEINLSAIELVQDKFAEKIIDITHQYGIEPGKINFEITESTASTIETYVKRNMLLLKNSGFTFALDDFGTGYSNLDSIITLPFSIIKVDRSMLLGYFRSPETATVFLGSVKMIQDLNMKVVVEGAETKDHIDLLLNNQVDYIQGFYYSRPILMEDFVEFIKQHNK